MDTALSVIKAAFKDTKALNLVNDKEFIERLKTYQDKVITPVVNRLNDLQKLYKLDITEKYGKGDYSMVTDVLEAHKGDAQLALKMFGIHDRDAFNAILTKNANDMGMTILP